MQRDFGQRRAINARQLFPVATKPWIQIRSPSSVNRICGRGQGRKCDRRERTGATIHSSLGATIPLAKHMASGRQFEANLTNALKSTGPRSEAGRAISSRNALAHGLTSRQALLPGEDAQRFAELKGAIFGNLKPDGVIEIELVERVASLHGA